MNFPHPSEMMKMFHPNMSYENDSDYRKLENFENSSADQKSLGGRGSDLGGSVEKNR